VSGRGISSQLSLTKSIKRSNQRSNRRKALGQELSIEPLSSVVDAATAAGMPKQVIAPSDAKWDNVADLFWLGSELDWTAQTVLRGAPKDFVRQSPLLCSFFSALLVLSSRYFLFPLAICGRLSFLHASSLTTTPLHEAKLFSKDEPPIGSLPDVHWALLMQAVLPPCAPVHS